MKSFLEYVAADLLEKYGTDLSHVALVFPNKRASLFTNTHLAKLAKQPVWTPSYITISDFFRKQSSLTVADDMKLVCDLYKSYIKCTGKNETLDHFYSWGQLLLSDFDDIDKNMADASQVFSNLKHIHELDDVSYLSEDQINVLKRFFSNFSEEHNSELKKKFLELWSHLFDIYKDYKQRLEEQGFAYEGMLYREIAERGKLHTDHELYIFVGFNLLHQVEKRVFQMIHQEGKARFYWDFDVSYKNADSEAGRFIVQHLAMFPNELDIQQDEIYNNFNKEKQITYISATTENIQARFVSKWLRDQNRYRGGKETAVVMCDEHLLPTVIHCLPDEVEKVNITTGYPLQSTLISSFVMQWFNYCIYGGKRTYKRLIHHPYASLIAEEMLAENVNDIISSALTLVKTIAEKTKNDNDGFQQEAIFRMYTLLNRMNNLIQSGDLTADSFTIQKLVQQHVNTISIPFHGEPIEGVQIMGVLETRNLDFKHLLLLSCNEGNMPKGINDSSFIPYSIRKAFGLTTIDNKVAVFAYYFHRLLQKAEDITILYNNSTDDGQTGEMSRFMLQMMVEGKHLIRRMSLNAGQKQIPIRPHAIKKTEESIQILYEMADKGIYPTFINRYLRCPLQFYFNNISGIKEPDNDDEDLIDNRAFGNIFHKASQILYDTLTEQSQCIMPGDIEYIEKHPHKIEWAVDEAFRQEMKIDAPENGLHLINREVIIQYIKRLLAIDKELAPFQVLGLEKFVQGELDIQTSRGVVNVKIGGIVDRLDMVKDSICHEETIRVVDYKTGGKKQSTKVYSVEELFERPINPQKHADYYIQTMLYSHLVSKDARLNSHQQPVSPALLFIQHTNEEPTLVIGKEKIKDIKKYDEEFISLLKNVLVEIFEPETDFIPTEDRNICQTCHYKQLCGL
ncbi:MAG: PD-(D/E)XK nuclease family protein [Prevotella sp.]|nr:PD-(D/E)XK nuclease family protein [Prevotella sp.]